MMKMGFDRLIGAVKAKNNPTVAGLDPTLDMIPEFIKAESFEKFGNTFEGAADALLTFNKGLIDALCDIVPAVKPQCAYYEMYSWQGIKALYDTISYAREKGMFIITDGKRNDIGSTMTAYAAGHLGTTSVAGTDLSAFDADALTVNAYLGTDGIEPLLPLCKERDKGIFALCKTSNKSSGELQDKLIDGQPVYKVMGGLIEQWGAETISPVTGYSAVGAVVGATYPEQLKKMRSALPHTFFLVPGYGAQGGGAGDIKFAFDQNGIGAIVNSSRAIMTAYKKEGAEKDYAAAARAEAKRMRDDINSVL